MLSGSECCIAGCEERALGQASGSGGHAGGRAVQAFHLLAEGSAVQPSPQGHQVNVIRDSLARLRSMPASFSPGLASTANVS